MIQYLRHNIRIYPDRDQSNSLMQAIGMARLSYNFAVDKWRSTPSGTSKPSPLNIDRIFNQTKREIYPWLNDSKSVCFGKITQYSIKTNFKAALDNCYKRKLGAPTFKRKSQSDTASCDNQAFYIVGKKLKFAGVSTLIRTAEELRFSESKLISCTVGRNGKRWYASINVETKVNENQSHSKPDTFVGVDLGLKTAIQLSDDTQLLLPASALAKKAKRLVRYQRSFARKLLSSRGEKTRSNRCKKIQEKIQHLHNDIANIRHDFWHKSTTLISRDFETICVENLNIRGMQNLKTLRSKLQSTAIGKFLPMMRWKCVKNGSKLVVADRYFPSSKTCNNCGTINRNLKLGVSSWICECGSTNDRDLNAAKNLEDLARSSTRISTNVELPMVCGEVKTLERNIESRYEEVSVKVKTGKKLPVLT